MRDFASHRLFRIARKWKAYRACHLRCFESSLRSTLILSGSSWMSQLYSTSKWHHDLRYALMRMLASFEPMGHGSTSFSYVIGESTNYEMEGRLIFCIVRAWHTQVLAWVCFLLKALWLLPWKPQPINIDLVLPLSYQDLVLRSMDPISCVGVATLLSNVCDLLNAYRNAQKDFRKLYEDCQNFARVLRSLQSECGMVKDLEWVDRRALGDSTDCNIASYSS